MNLDMGRPQMTDHGYTDEQGNAWTLEELLADLDRGDNLYLTPKMCADLAKHLRQHGPSRPEWRKIDDGCGTPHAIHVTRTELEKEQPLTFWTMYLGEFYECRVYLYPVETPPPATKRRQ